MKKQINRAESKKLEEETKALEEKIKQLKTNMDVEKTNVGGQSNHKWSRAQPGIGSISNYAKDVKNKLYPIKVTKSAAESKLLVPRKEDVCRWNESQVCVWLTNTVGLPEYCTIFQKNKINGEVLLAMTSEDLDFLKINILGHRKLILKSIQNISTPLPPRQSTPNTLPELTQSKQSDTQLIHWTQVSSSDQINIKDESIGDPSNQRNNLNFNNKENNNNNDNSNHLLDGNFDELGSHSEFVDAVLEWRQSKNPTKIDTKGEWSNPLDNISHDSDTNHKEAVSPVRRSPIQGHGSSLKEGKYDEEKERVSFQEAVMEWRHNKEQPSNHVSIKSQQCDIQSKPKLCCWICYKIITSDNIHKQINDKVFCSGRCENQYHNEQSSICPNCNKSFLKSDGIQFTGFYVCSQNCYSELSRKQLSTSPIQLLDEYNSDSDDILISDFTDKSKHTNGSHERDYDIYTVDINY